VSRAPASRDPRTLLELRRWPEPRDIFVIRAHRAARSDLKFVVEFDTHLRRFVPLHIQSWLHENIDDSSEGFYDPSRYSRRPAKPAGYDQARHDVNCRIPRMMSIVGRTGPRAAIASLESTLDDWPAHDQDGRNILGPVAQVVAKSELLVEELRNRARNPLYWGRDALTLMLYLVAYPVQVLGIDVSGLLARLALRTPDPKP
jgi:hypothetical protein